MTKRRIVRVYEMDGCSGEEERVSQEYFWVMIEMQARMKKDEFAG